MTHQQMIIKWSKEVERIESEIHFQSNDWIRYKMKEELRMATLFYLELCQMEIEEPITITSTSLPTGCMYSGKPMEGKELDILQETSKRIISDKSTTLRK